MENDNAIKLKCNDPAILAPVFEVQAMTTLRVKPEEKKYDFYDYEVISISGKTCEEAFKEIRAYATAIKIPWAQTVHGVNWAFNPMDVKLILCEKRGEKEFPLCGMWSDNFAKAIATYTEEAAREAEAVRKTEATKKEPPKEPDNAK